MATRAPCVRVTGAGARLAHGRPATAGHQQSAGYPRLSVAERYASKEKSLRLGEESARALIDEGYMLEEDLEPVVERAGSKFDYFVGNGKEG